MAARDDCDAAGLPMRRAPLAMRVRARMGLVSMATVDVRGLVVGRRPLGPPITDSPSLPAGIIGSDGRVLQLGTLDLCLGLAYSLALLVRERGFPFPFPKPAHVVLARRTRTPPARDNGGCRSSTRVYLTLGDRSTRLRAVFASPFASPFPPMVSLVPAPRGYPSVRGESLMRARCISCLFGSRRVSQGVAPLCIIKYDFTGPRVALEAGLSVDVASTIEYRSRVQRRRIIVPRAPRDRARMGPSALERALLFSIRGRAGSFLVVQYEKAASLSFEAFLRDAADLCLEA